MNHVCVIAEAGVNHNGSVDLAKKMIDAAYTAGADYIKFQTFIPKNMVAVHAQRANYQRKAQQEQSGSTTDETQFEMLNRLALTFEDFTQLKEYAMHKGIGFLSTPFDLESVAFLDTLGMDFWKLPSGEVTNLPFLEAIAKTGKPIVMSTGMCTLEEVREALGVIRKFHTSNLTLLQCNTEYPTPYSDVNLRAMKTMQEEFRVPVGYSDHTQGIAMSLAAVALGAQVIEKHFTLDRQMEGPDHKASLIPEELEELVMGIRQIELGLGSGIKIPSESEKKNIDAARKSIVAGKVIHKGEPFSVDNLAVKRPGSGLSPMKWNQVLGQRANRDYKADELLDDIIE